ncbi:DUF5348 domain-containing protein [Clostridium butyricum]|uniref:DUF5348 domain-containing protein n=1 Tax=Clostridium butyricum TaxID=1492 RepID=UPI0022E446AE|nr:DUF5348 domain-containing protein [Clostridium butyricum]
MIDKDFIEIENEARELKVLIKRALDNYKREGFENNHIYNKLENHFSEEVNDLVKYMGYIQKETKEYTLKLRNDGRYETNDEAHYFTSGSSIEVYIDNVGWCTGRVECRHDDDRSIYYFLNNEDDNVDLFEGMKIRLRF